jgi:NADH-ubiquinone oxidoreductase chain 4
MLTSLLLIPILGILTLSPMQETSAEDKSRMKQIALFVTLLNFIVSLVLWGEFDSNSSQYQFTAEFFQLSFCHFNIGVDGLSLYFVLLTTFTMPICILASWENVQHNLKYFLVAFLLVETLLIALFVVLDLLLFYVFFESVLVPLFLIVGIWGASETRIRASFLLFMYTLFGSLFMLLAFLVIIYNVGTSDLQMLSLADISFDSQKVLWLAIFLSFAIKTPLVPFHIWLPRAHVEAPLAGSIVLAGLILKLAVYGFLRILIPLLPEATSYFSPLVQTIAVITLVYSSLTTLRQTDFKCLVAYSSIAHMSVVVAGVFSNTIQGIEGGIMLSIAHGFVSPALFMLVGGVLYDRYHTRVIRYYRGMTLFMPIFAALFFVFTIANAGTPLTANWIGEFLSLNGTFMRSPVVGLLMSTGIVFSAGYSIWLFNRICFGAFSPYLTVPSMPVNGGGDTHDVTRREYMVLLALLIPTFVFGIWPNIILNDLHYSVSTLIYV